MSYRYLVDCSNGWDRGSHVIWLTLKTKTHKKIDLKTLSFAKKKFLTVEYLVHKSLGSDEFSTKVNGYLYEVCGLKCVW